jgi:hypothetical protein
MKSLFVLSLLLLTLLVFPVSSLAATLTFDEFGASPLLNVDGMHVFGVTFHFSPGSADYNGQIGTAGLTVLVSDPLLTGPTTGTLTITFDNPTPLLQFDLALLSLDTIDPAYLVVLSSGDVLSGSTMPQPDGLYSEGTFLYTGAPVSEAAITFFNGTDSMGGDVSAFGLDNLTYQTPEPNTSAQLAGSLLVMGVIGRRKSLG